MGEEFDLGKLILMTPDGKSVEWNGIQSVSIVPDAEVNHEENKFYAALKASDTIECSMEAQISKIGWLTILLGANKRMIRRALRWYEWLRRQELKGKITIGNKLDLAAQCAQFKSNNGKRAGRMHTYVYTVRMERETA